MQTQNYEEKMKISRRKFRLMRGKKAKYWDVDSDLWGRKWQDIEI